MRVQSAVYTVCLNGKVCVVFMFVKWICFLEGLAAVCAEQCVWFCEINVSMCVCVFVCV